MGFFIYLTILISHQNLTVKDFVVPQNVIDHLLVQILRRGLEGDFHASGLFCFQIDIAVCTLSEGKKEKFSTET
jgi:hypothetical protein